MMSMSANVGTVYYCKRYQ